MRRAGAARPNPDRRSSSARPPERSDHRRATVPRAESPPRARRAIDPAAPDATSPGSRPSRPSSVHSACSLVRSSGARATRCRNAGTTAGSPRSTSRRCAVSRHQPLGCASTSTSSLGEAADSVGLRPRRVRLVHDAIDAAVAGRVHELVPQDVIPEVLGHEDPVLNHPAIHVDDVERAVGRRREVHRTKPLVGRCEEFARPRTPCAPSAPSRRR